MVEISLKVNANARKIETTILCAFARLSQRQVAEVAGVSETKISRFASEKLAEIALILAASGLAVVTEDAQVVSKTEKAFMAEKMIEHYQAVLDDCRQP